MTKQHPILVVKTEQKEEASPEIIELTRQSEELTLKLTELNTIRTTLYQDLAKHAQGTYATQMQQLFEQVQALFVTDQQLKQLEYDVLMDLKRVLAKY